MSRRQAGEDFYFIQKVAMQGRYGECRTTRVHPSPRPSDRVPFGTGPDIARQIGNRPLDASAKHPDDRDHNGTGPDNEQSAVNGLSGTSAKHPDDRDHNGTGPENSQLPPYLTYHPQLFEHLKQFFELIPCLYRSGSIIATVDIAPENDSSEATDGDHAVGTKTESTEINPPAATEGDPPAGRGNAAVLNGVPPVLGRYLEESGFWEALEEIRGNTASEGAFRKRFLGKFNMFWILKYLHYAEEHGVEKMEVTAAAGMMLEMWENAHGRGMPDGKGPDSGEDSPIGEKDSPIREKDSPIRKEDSPIREKDSPIREKDSPKGSPTREMLLLYRKYFGSNSGIPMIEKAKK
jgi:hypothetical protein